MLGMFVGIVLEWFWAWLQEPLFDRYAWNILESWTGFQSHIQTEPGQEVIGKSADINYPDLDSKST